MNTFSFNEHPHRRRNPLTGDWVLVSPHRTKRPWQGGKEKIAETNRPEYDPTCYLCPGNSRANGEVNPQYLETFVFTNDFAAMLPDTPQSKKPSEKLVQYQSVQGTSRVICFSPKHHLTLPELSVDEIKSIIQVWKAQFDELSQTYDWVQIFENKGTVMGCSNPHPHGQIWASNFLPNEAAKENQNQIDYLREYQSNLLLDYAFQESTERTRIVEENEEWVVVVPFWAVWPFETLLLPKVHVPDFNHITLSQQMSLAEILKAHLTRYDNLFEVSFPYSMGWHGCPKEGNYKAWQLHAHFYPPLLRSATVKKFMVGYEMMAEAQRDITAEQAAERLRLCSDIHYKSQST